MLAEHEIEQTYQDTNMGGVGIEYGLLSERFAKWAAAEGLEGRMELNESGVWWFITRFESHRHQGEAFDILFLICDDPRKFNRPPFRVISVLEYPVVDCRTDADFQKLLNIMSAVNYDRVYLYPDEESGAMSCEIKSECLDFAWFTPETFGCLLGESFDFLHGIRGITEVGIRNMLN